MLLLDVNEGLADSPLRRNCRCVRRHTPWLLLVRVPSDSRVPSRLSNGSQHSTLRRTNHRLLKAKAAAVLECGTNLRDNKVRLDGYTMLEVAADLRDLAYALKMDRVSISSTDTPRQQP